MVNGGMEIPANLTVPRREHVAGITLLHHNELGGEINHSRTDEPLARRAFRLQMSKKRKGCKLFGGTRVNHSLFTSN